MLSVQISKNQQFAVTTSFDKTIRIWDFINCDGSHKIVTSSNWTDIDACIILDDDKRIIAVVNYEGAHQFAEVRDMETGQLVRKANQGVRPATFLQLFQKYVTVHTKQCNMIRNVRAVNTKQCNMIRNVRALRENENVLGSVGESCAQVTCLEKRIFVPLENYRNKIRYGNASKSVVLGTTEFNAKGYVYSKHRRIVVLLIGDDRLQLLQLHL